jgi:hypothetical protein
VDEAILDVVELVDVVHNFMTLFLYKVLDKSVSANGNTSAGDRGVRGRSNDAYPQDTNLTRVSEIYFP